MADEVKTLRRPERIPQVDSWMAEPPDPPVAGDKSDPSSASCFRDSRTRPIVQRIFCLLLREGGVRRDTQQLFEADLTCWGERDGRVIRDASDKVREIVCTSAEFTVARNVESFERQHWAVTQADLYADFHRVAESSFSDEVNWGRIVAFLAFAVSFAVYTERRGCGAAQSIAAWTCQVVEIRLADFFIKNNGWVG